MTQALGVDPGRTGGAVFWQGGRVVVAVEWHPLVVGYALRVWTGDEVSRREVAHLAGVGAALEGLALALGEGRPWVVAIEGLYVPRTPALAASALTLAEAAGELGAALRGVADGAFLRPRATEWRRDVLGLSTRTPSKLAKRAAVERFGDELGALGRVEHVCDAAGIGWWAMGDAARPDGRGR